MAFKIAMSAGHGLNTPGKRCLKKLDNNETREWVLNNRIADKIEALLTEYTGYELLRLDDTTGAVDVPLKQRTDAANAFNANLYLSIHANAGIKGGKGGGIEAYVYTTVSDETVAWQEDLYNELIKATGLVGNRAKPINRANLHECRESNMPAVLLELGYMDSSVDVPIILSEEFANKCAEAIPGVLVRRGNLVKREEKELYRVQVGAYIKKANAEAMRAKLRAAGFNAYITRQSR